MKISKLTFNVFNGLLITNVIQDHLKTGLNVSESSESQE